MEGLGAAASVFAVVSVADQIAERVKQLYQFWSSVSEAPATIHAIAADLGLLSNVLAQISQNCQQHGTDSLTTDVLKGCKFSCIQKVN
jgi:hypothetical protein